ncbi:MAG: hypothetical protein HYY86_03210 [Candidatus Harrisonbacteria bacterium]|nr:hypothetical protein [Candidatus Harrisonbacteria bacterium]
MDKIIQSKALVFGLPIFIFIADVVLIVFNRELITVTSPWMHLTGGFSMGLIFLYFWGEDLRLSGAGKNFLFSVIMTAAFAVLIGVLWEFSEFFFSVLFPEFPTQPSVADTMADLFLDFLGGLLLASIYCKSKLYKEPSFNK